MLTPLHVLLTYKFPDTDDFALDDFYNRLDALSKGLRKLVDSFDHGMSKEEAEKEDEAVAILTRKSSADARRAMATLNKALLYRVESNSMFLSGRKR